MTTARPTQRLTPGEHLAAFVLAAVTVLFAAVVVYVAARFLFWAWDASAVFRSVCAFLMVCAGVTWLSTGGRK